MTKFAIIIASFIFLTAASNLSCSVVKNRNPENMQQQKRYLALGDSYTIGEAVEARENFPSLLVKQLALDGIEVAAAKIIAITGWTTTDLKHAIEAENPSKDYDLVTLLIGVNNQYQQKAIDLYKKEFASLLEDAISFAGGDAKKVIVISIPDYGVTAFAKNSDSKKIAQELDEYNAIAKNITENLHIHFVDITPISRAKNDHENLEASDGLHPSPYQYRLWVSEIFPFAKNILQL